MNFVPSPWKHLADDLQQQINIERDKQSVEWTLQTLLEAGQYEWIERLCQEWLSKTERKDLVR